MKRERIERKIWKVMIVIIIALSSCMFVLNVMIVNNLKEKIIFEELEQRVMGRFGDVWDKEKIIQKRDRYDEEKFAFENLHTRSFRVTESGEIVADYESDDVEVIKERREALESIYRDILRDKGNEEGGKIKVKGRVFYYMVDRKSGDGSLKVYFILYNKEPSEKILFIIVFVAFVVLSYIPAKYVSRGIGKHINMLEEYSQNISRRNWKVVRPQSDISEIHELAVTMEKMKIDLKTAEERDREFLQKTSHDLKTPVMIIKGYAQAIIDGVHIDGDELPQEVILSEANRLERKIKQLLYINTISHSIEQHEGYENIRLDRLIKSVVQRFRVVNPKIEWKTELCENEMKGNKELLLVAFENIFDNQTRFAKSFVNVIMEVKDEGLKIRIQNDGPRFKISNPNILFDSYKKDMEGNFGLGLAIVKKVIQGHNGYIKAYNEENGVVFEIVLK